MYVCMYVCMYGRRRADLGWRTGEGADQVVRYGKYGESRWVKWLNNALKIVSLEDEGRGRGRRGMASRNDVEEISAMLGMLGRRPKPLTGAGDLASTAAWRTLGMLGNPDKNTSVFSLSTHIRHPSPTCILNMP